MRRLAAFIMRGRVHAVFAACALGLMSWIVPFCSLLAAAAVGLPTLRKGAYEGGAVMLASVAVLGALGGFLIGSLFDGAAFGLLLWVPIWLAAVILRESGKLSTTFGFVSVMGLLVVTMVYWLHPDPSSIWLEGLERFLKPLMDNTPPDFDKEQFWNNLSVLAARYMTGIVSASLVISLILSLMIARWWQAVLFNPGGFRSEFVGLRMPAMFPCIAVGALIVAMAANEDVAEVALNLSLPLFALFLLVGFSVLHALVSHNKVWKVWLVGTYIALLFVPYIIVPIALVGLSDPWFDWRKRLSPG
jgi:hypothetical protein